MSAKMINLLMASSADTAAAIEQALQRHNAEILVHRIDKQQDLHQALESQDWHMAFSDLELSNFSALEFAKTLREKGIAAPDALTAMAPLAATDETADASVAGDSAPSVEQAIAAARVPTAALDAPALDEQLRRVVAREGLGWFLDTFVPAFMAVGLPDRDEFSHRNKPGHD
jgi:CheY-like chemotaxis protein